MASAGTAVRRADSPRGGRRERHRTEIRERLFSAALRLFAERGYLETTVEDITEAADVGKGTFFNYFPTKEHVLATFGAERIAAIEHALDEAKKGPVLPVLKQLAADLASQSSANAALLRAIFAAHASCEPVRAELHRRLLMGRRLMTEIFTLAQERGEVRRDIPAAELARLIQTVLLGVTLAWAMNPDCSLRGTAVDVWALLSPNLRGDEKANGVGGRRGAKA
ncbi:MAG: TetR family transcriptional regulator [Candidatus Acidiferrales bacterium]|jgi:AcrR family transcriptional regulator